MKLNFEKFEKNNIDYKSFIYSIENLIERKNSKEIGFLDLPYTNTDTIKSLAKKYRENNNTLIILGIGGSSLGGKTLISALSHLTDKKVLFLDNVDSDCFYESISQVNLDKTVFNVISKSGSTAETMAQFLYVYNLLKDKYGKDKAIEKIILTTSPEKGALRPLVNEMGFNSLEIPENVGGRFSVLTAVGLFAGTFAGLNIDKILEGAKKQTEDFINNKEQSNVFKYSVINHLHCENGKNEIVLMPYSTKLAELSFWFVQLWNESLGKDGKGQTAIPAIGATDQHSQVQLFMEGLKNKVINFIRVKTTENRVMLKSFDKEVEAFSYLSGHTMHELMEAEMFSTQEALFEQGVNSVMIEIDKLNELALGELFMFFEIAVSITGEIWKINTFNQPGVELGKIYTYKKMGRRGY